MKKNLTEIVFIIDRSGSMYGLEKDTIGGFNSTIDKQKKEEGDAFVTTIMFNHTSKIIHDRIKIDEVKPLTLEDYQPNGSTALIDALADAIEHVKTIHKYINQEDVPENTIFVIITDGMENSSHKYTSDEVKKQINFQKEKGWQFIFLGANIDAVETAKKYGISNEYAVNYNCDKPGLNFMYNSVSSALSLARQNELSEDWKKEAEEDYNNRRK